MNAAFLAVASAVLWAISALVVSRGLALLPANRAGAMILGLVIALVSGSTLLLLAFGSTLRPADVSAPIVVAGLLTFPLATGAYYVASVAFRGRAEVAAQFSQVKPVISVLLGASLLSEPLHSTSWLSLVFVASGIALLIAAQRRGHVSAIAIVLGLALASAWAAGEVAVAFGAEEARGIQHTTVALVAGTLAGLVIAVPALAVIGWPAPGKWMMFFALHGLLSFATAYAFYFQAIREIGVASTALINAFWPMLSLVLGRVIAKRYTGREAIPTLVWVAAVLLLAGSLAAIWGA